MKTIRKFRLAAAVCLTVLFLPAPGRSEQTRYRFCEEGKIGFEAESTLHPFGGKANRFKGDFSVDWENISLSKGGQIEVEAASIDTGSRLRDNKMRKGHLRADQYPLIRFHSIGCSGILDAAPAKESRLILKGTLDLCGVQTPIELPVVVTRQSGGRLRMEGKIPLSLSRYGIPVPSVLGLVKMEDQVTVVFDLTAETSRE